MVNVIKRDGRKQAFSRSKLAKAIEKASKEAKVPAAKRRILQREVIAGVVASIGRRSTVKASEIRQRVLSTLQKKSKATVNAWKRYDAKKKKSAAKRKSTVRKTARKAKPARKRKTVRKKAPKRKTARVKRVVRKKTSRRKGRR